MSSVNGTARAPPPETSANTFNPSMAIIIVVLVGACLVVALFSMYIRRCTQGDDGNGNRGASRRNENQSIHFFERPGEGLERAIIDGLPLVSFSVVKTLKAGKEDFECAVCLEKFEDDESLRLLPKCSHVFHTECIDAWFLSHFTCPLCRTSLKPTVEERTAGVPAVGEVSRRILEAQELFGSARLAYDEDSLLDENEVFEGSSREVGRDMERSNERNSARMALFRNSDSFRQAARGVEVRERLASLSARYPASSSADVYKDTQRALSLSCISLQRTNSSNVGGTRGLYNSEVLFKYGSQRYGAAGASFDNSLGRLGSLNERELQETGDQSNIALPSATGLQRATSSSSEHWTALELNGAADSTPTDNPDTVSVTPDTRPMLEKPRSGPLIGKQVIPPAHRKSGSTTWEQRVRTERGSLRGLRGSFSALHRSASEGRAQLFAMEPLPTSTESTAAPLAVAPAADTDNSTTGTTLAQRTIAWLSGGNKHTRSSSARTSLEQRNANALQQIVTE